jgi:hypothetical protein
VKTVDFDSSRHVFRSPQFQSVVNDAITFLGATPAYTLPLPGAFGGCGVYALYYVGSFELYIKLAKKNKRGCVQPIYVGKAVPPGWRTGRVLGSESPDLYRRLTEHIRSIQQSANLRTEDFKCRFVILGGVESDLVVPIEAELIRRYQPLWNTLVDGFGNHDPGSGRYNQAKSEWDVLHPGRSWAERLTGQSPNLEEITARIQRFLK